MRRLGSVDHERSIRLVEDQFINRSGQTAPEFQTVEGPRTARANGDWAMPAASGTGRGGRIEWQSGNPIEFQETSMRLPVRVPLIAAALLSVSTAAPAQSAGSYPFCAIYYRMDAGGTPSCYFDTRAQCMETISGVGGFCIENQYYHRVAIRLPRRVHVAKARKRTHPSSE